MYIHLKIDINKQGRYKKKYINYEDSDAADTATIANDKNAVARRKQPTDNNPSGTSPDAAANNSSVSERSDSRLSSSNEHS